MKIDLIGVPYNQHRRGVGMGAGPGRIIEARAAEMLADQGYEVVIKSVEPRGELLTTEGAMVAIDWQLAEEVSQSTANGAFPIILSGDCHTSLGTLKGLGGDKVGIIWFDAHGDFNTPETSPSGYIDGMTLATIAGRAREDLRLKIGLNNPVPEKSILLLGVRDLDPGELLLLEDSSVLIILASKVRSSSMDEALLPQLEKLQAEVKDIYLHLDLDVLDPDVALVNEYSAAPGGLTIEEIEEAISSIGNRFNVRAAALTAYNPSVAPDNKPLDAALRLLAALAKLARGTDHEYGANTRMI